MAGQHVFLYSDYMWSAPENLDLSRHLKSLRPDVINIHGGPYVVQRVTRRQWELASTLARSRVGDLGSARVNPTFDFVHPEVALPWAVVEG